MKPRITRGHSHSGAQRPKRMSSLAATQADGYYIDPDGRYKKDQKRKKQAKNGSTTTVRFELPIQGVCLHCHAHIEPGTRFNASKRNTEEYYLTTRIIEFRMTCRACAQQEFVIRTDPQQATFQYLQGIRKRIQTERTHPSNTTTSATTTDMTSTSTTTRINNRNISLNVEETDPLLRLERQELDQRNAVAERQELFALQKKRHQLYQQDADQNARLRDQFRDARRIRRQQLHDGRTLGWRQGMPLFDATLQDECQSKSQTYRHGKQQELERLRSIRRSSIFGNANRTRRTTTTSTACTRSKARTTVIATSSTSSTTVIATSSTTSTTLANQKVKKRTLVVPPLPTMSKRPATKDSVKSDHGDL